MCSGSGAGLWCLGGLLVVLLKSSEDFFFLPGPEHITERQSGVLHVSVIFQTSNTKVFHTIPSSVMSEGGLVLTPVRPRNMPQQTNGGGSN